MYDILYNFIYLATSAIFIAAVFWGTLRLMDRALGVSFDKEIYPKIKENPQALATYAVGRLIALAILYSPLLRVIL